MSLLDEKITALFRRGSPIINNAESAPSVDRPIAEKAALKLLRSKRQLQRGSTTNLNKRQGQSKQAHYGRGWI